MAWAHDGNASRVLWLSGMAGSGKTAVAVTLCAQLAQRGWLGGSFLIVRDDVTRMDASNVVRTLAYDLALRHPAIRTCLVRALRMHCSYATRPLAEQIQDLLAKPLAELSHESIVILVIDGLDESRRSNGILKEGMIGHLLFYLPKHIKILLTSTPSHAIADIFRKAHLLPQVLKLQDIPYSCVASDIGMIFGHRFHLLKEDGRVSQQAWPAQRDKSCLVQATGYMFLYATTVLRYLSNDRFDPEQRLASLCKTLQESATGLPSLDPLNAIDRLYEALLEDSVIDLDSGQRSAELCNRVQQLLALIVVSQERMSLSCVSALIGKSETLVQRDLDALSSLLHVPPAGSMDHVSIFHSTLTGFLCNRCKDAELRVHESKEHAKVALRCFNLLKALWNQAPSITWQDQDSHYIRSLLFSPAHRYACVYWPSHLAVADYADPCLLEELMGFKDRLIPDWLESILIFGPQEQKLIAGGLAAAVDWCECHVSNHSLPLLRTGHSSRTSPLLQLMLVLPGN
jgi:hypothetical protein